MVAYNHKHEIDMDKAEFVPGVGYKGICKECGTTVFQRRVMRPFTPAQMYERAGTRKRQSKKERLKERKKIKAAVEAGKKDGE